MTYYSSSPHVSQYLYWSALKQTGHRLRLMRSLQVQPCVPW